MNVRLLVVRSSAGEASCGTCWFIDRARVVTAFHLVGRSHDASRGRWLHEDDPSVRYLLRVDGAEVELTPLMRDCRSDIALLEVDAAQASGSVLQIADRVNIDTSWRAEGFPGTLAGNQFVLSGRVTAIRAERELQLLIDQDTRVDWAGMSGAPLIRVADGRVIGVLKSNMTEAATGWAAHGHAVRLLWDSSKDSGFRSACQAALLECFHTGAELQAWAHDIFEHLRIDAETPQALARCIVDTAFVDGPRAVQAMLDALGRDRPDFARVRQLQQKLRPSPRRLARSRASVVREVVQRLTGHPHGVALLAPLGFGAAHVVERVFDELESSPGRLLPIRMVPDRRTRDEQHLYGALERDLQHGLEARLGPLPADILALFETNAPRDGRSFEELIESLVVGPLRERQRTLTLIVEDLARIEPRLLRTFGYLLQRLTRKGAGLKLLASGGEELYVLRVDRNDFSVFHELDPVTLEPLSSDDVRDLAQRELGADLDDAACAALLEHTGGHPALLSELLDLEPEAVRDADGAAMHEALSQSEHSERLHRFLAADVDARHGTSALLRQERLDRKSLQRLRWLGIIHKVEKEWTWIAPVFRKLLDER